MKINRSQNSLPLDAVLLISLAPKAELTEVQQAQRARHTSPRASSVLQFDALWHSDGSIDVVEVPGSDRYERFDRFMGQLYDSGQDLLIQDVRIALDRDVSATGEATRSWAVSANTNEHGVYTDPSVVAELMRDFDGGFDGKNNAMKTRPPTP